MGNKFWRIGASMGVVCMLLLVVFYVCYARTWVASLYVGKASSSLTEAVQWIYPRFFTEKHRFPLAFFLQKADQLMLRFCLATLLLIGLFLSYQYEKTKRYLFPTLALPTQALTILRYYFVGLVFVFTWDWFFELRNLYEARAFYQPVFILKVLHLPFPTVQVSAGLCVLMWASALGILGRGQARLYASILFFVLFVLLQGYQMSFHKLDHTFALFTYWAGLMPFIIWESRLALPNDARTSPAWAVSVLQLALALPYVLAGVEKIAIGGLAWFRPETFRAYLHLHSEPWGLWVAQSDALCVLLGGGMLVFEVGFILVVFYRWAKFVFLPIGILFHLGTYTLMGAGAWIHPWWLCYGVFLFSPKKQAPQ